MMIAPPLTYSAAVDVPNPVLVIVVVNTLEASHDAVVWALYLKVFFEFVDPLFPFVPAVVNARIPLAAILVFGGTHIFAVKAPPAGWMKKVDISVLSLLTLELLTFVVAFWKF